VTRYPDVLRSGALPGLETAPPPDNRPRAAHLGALAHEELTARGWQADPKLVVPLYVRPSEAELGARKREAASSPAG